MAFPALIAFAEIDVAVPQGPRGGFDYELLGLIVGLVVLVAVGVTFALKTRDRAKTGAGDAAPEHSLAHYQDLLKKGLLDPHEFERIRVALSRKPPSAPPTIP